MKKKKLQLCYFFTEWLLQNSLVFSSDFYSPATILHQFPHNANNFHLSYTKFKSAVIFIVLLEFQKTGVENRTKLFKASLLKFKSRGTSFWGTPADLLTMQKILTFLFLKQRSWRQCTKKNFAAEKVFV